MFGVKTIQESESWGRHLWHKHNVPITMSLLQSTAKNMMCPKATDIKKQNQQQPVTNNNFLNNICVTFLFVFSVILIMQLLYRRHTCMKNI